MYVSDVHLQEKIQFDFKKKKKKEVKLCQMCAPNCWLDYSYKVL